MSEKYYLLIGNDSYIRKTEISEGVFHQFRRSEGIPDKVETLKGQVRINLFNTVFVEVEREE